MSYEDACRVRANLRCENGTHLVCTYKNKWISKKIEFIKSDKMPPIQIGQLYLYTAKRK